MPWEEKRNGRENTLGREGKARSKGESGKIIGREKSKEERRNESKNSVQREREKRYRKEN